jgi:hypothetical protein
MANQIPVVKRCPRRDSGFYVHGEREMKTCMTKYVILLRPNLGVDRYL